MFANNKMRENSGRLIKIYRERMHQGSKDKRFSCNEFILATKDHPFYEIVEGEPVCSRATLNRLERGQIIKDDELYVFFIEKLGFKVDDFPGVMSQVDLISDELLKAIEKYDVGKIREIDNSIEILFKRAKYYFYYSNIYEVFKIITNYYLYVGYPKKDTADLMIKVRFILNSKLEELLLNILFDYFYYWDSNMYIAEDIYQNLICFKNDSKISAYFIAGWLMYKEKWFDALEITNDAIEYYDKLNSNYHLGILYFTKALALHTGNKENVKYYFDKSIKCLSLANGTLRDKKLEKNYFNIGFHYYYDKDYLAAIDYFKKYLEYNPPFTMHILYILHCTEELKTNELDDFFIKLKCDENKKNDICKVFYKYFLLKLNKAPEKEIENYIMHDIHKLLVSKYRSDNLINYFEFELNKLVKVTKCYKDLKNFNDFTSYKID